MNQMTLIDPTNAKLPQTYQAAKQALKACYTADECKGWSDRAAAMASYAKQAEDNALYKMAKRIQGRAIRRLGQLRKEIEPGKTGPKPKLEAGAQPQWTRTQADAAAGISPHQAKQANNVANIPEEQFEAAIEADNPPTIGQLADMGREKKPKPLVDLGGRTHTAFNQAMHFTATVQRFPDSLSEYDILSLELDDEQKARVASAVSEIEHALQKMKEII